MTVRLHPINCTGDTEESRAENAATRRVIKPEITMAPSNLYRHLYKTLFDVEHVCVLKDFRT